MITAFGAGAPVFQFTLICSHRPFFVCFVCVTYSSVASKYPHLRPIVQQVFSKKFSAFPHSDGTEPAIITGLATIR
jgi:hypothetical protein